MGKYLDQAIVENALSPDTIAALFTDETAPGVLNAPALLDTIERAEGEVDGFLATVENLDPTALNRFDRLLREAALDFFKCFAYERRPEYEKTFGDSPRGSSLYKRAIQRMERIQSGVQRLPDQGSNKPGNVGALITGGGPRMILPPPWDPYRETGF